MDRTKSIEALAKILHDAWRVEKIKIGWHINKDCPYTKKAILCSKCHPCVDEWEKLTDDQKALPLQNARLAHEYFISPNRYTITFGGHSSERFDFYTYEDDKKLVLEEASKFADLVFGLRKNYMGGSIFISSGKVVFPMPYRYKGATHLLQFQGYDYLWDASKENRKGEPWKLFSQDEWCTCKEMGEEELSCKVHHFWVENHSEVCQCQAGMKEQFQGQ